jgi:hypothetical protein
MNVLRFLALLFTALALAPAMARAVALAVLARPGTSRG